MSAEEDRSKTERIYDKRTLDRNLRKGLVSPKDVEKVLAALPDLQDKVAPPPPELTFTPVPAAAPSPSIPTYIITHRSKDAFAADDDDTELLADDDDDEDDDLDDEDEDLEDEDEDLEALPADLPEAG
jgi:hypothetical protein